MTSTAAIAQPCINHHHLSFNHGYSLSSSAITTTTFSSPRLHVYKAYNSIQINNNPNYHQGQQHSRNSTNSTTFPSIPRNSTGASDSELRAVLELATNSELLEIEKILFGPSYLSPLLKSLSNGIELDRFMIEEDFEQREHFIEVLESRFLYLAADARSTLRLDVGGVAGGPGAVLVLVVVVFSACGRWCWSWRKDEGGGHGGVDLGGGNGGR
uniref:Uncharacterized protein n=1 Tax=Chenopodium quinoa TaxID=63459 RepID=A0A803N761_CHEQI